MPKANMNLPYINLASQGTVQYKVKGQCRIKVKRLSRQQIDHWTRNKAFKGRSKSPGSNTKSKLNSKVTIISILKKQNLNNNAKAEAKSQSRIRFTGMNTDEVIEDNKVITGNVIPENEASSVQAEDREASLQTPPPPVVENGQATTAEFSSDNEAARDSDLDLGLSEETTAAIESIVDRLDVGDLQDDVDLGLDVIDTMSDHDEPMSPREEEIPTPREDIPSPHDIEIEPVIPEEIEQPSEAPPSSTQPRPKSPQTPIQIPNFSRTPVLKLARLRIGPDCFRKSGRVDLKTLQLASPEFFKFKVGSGDKEGKKRPPKPESTESKKPKKIKIDTSEKPKKVPPPKKVEVKKVSISKPSISSSSDSDSDSDLEELRKKIMKPKQFENKVNNDLVKQAKADLLKKKEVKKVEKTEKKPTPTPPPVVKKPMPKPNMTQIFTPCQVKVEKLSQKQIDRWTRRKAVQRARSISVSSDTKSKVISKGIISSSDDSSDDENEAKPKKMMANPLFGFADQGKSEEEVKQVLVERLFSLLANDENKSPQKESAVEKTDDIKPAEEKPKEKSADQNEAKKDEPKPDEKEKEPKRNPIEQAKKEREKELSAIYANNKESVDVRTIAELRPFADLLKIEMSTGSLAFLGNYRITLKELEAIVHRVIKKLETPRPLEKPSSLPQPSAFQKVKYKIKDLRIKATDIKNKKDCKKAMEVYNAYMPYRVRKRKAKLLRYLQAVGDHRRNEGHHKRRAYDSDDSDIDVPKAKHHHKKARTEDSQFGSFK